MLSEEQLNLLSFVAIYMSNDGTVDDSIFIDSLITDLKHNKFPIPGNSDLITHPLDYSIFPFMEQCSVWIDGKKVGYVSPGQIGIFLMTPGKKKIRVRNQYVGGSTNYLFHVKPGVCSHFILRKLYFEVRGSFEIFVIIAILLQPWRWILSSFLFRLFITIILFPFRRLRYSLCATHRLEEVHQGPMTQELAEDIVAYNEHAK